MSLTTLAAVTNEIKGTEAQKATGTNQQIMTYIRTVTNRIRAFGYRFEPFYNTRKLTPSRMIINTIASSLSLGDTLCECTAITVGGQSFIYGTDILPYPNDGLTPIRQLRIALPSSGPINSWYPCCTSPDSWFESIAVTGFWAMRENYASMGFFTSSQTCPALNASQLSFVVTSVSGTDPYGRTPEFSAGNLIRIDNELMDVISTDTGTNTITVIRGVQGTTAVAHNVGTAIKVWEPEEQIYGVATRQAALLYARRGSYTEIQAGGVVVTYPSDLLPELRSAIQGFNYVPYRGG